MVNKAMVEFSETRLCIRAWKHEVLKCLRIQFWHLVKLHYLTFLFVTKRIFSQTNKYNRTAEEH
jgi:hypothetical protein